MLRIISKNHLFTLVSEETLWYYESCFLESILKSSPLSERHYVTTTPAPFWFYPRSCLPTKRQTKGPPKLATFFQNGSNVESFCLQFFSVCGILIVCKINSDLLSHKWQLLHFLCHEYISFLAQRSVIKTCQIGSKLMDFIEKCNLTLAMSPTCHSNNALIICWHDFP